MSRGLIAYLVLVVAPALVLGALAFLSAVRQRAGAVAEVQARTDERAEAIVERLAPDLEQAVRRAEIAIQRTREEGLTHNGSSELVAVMNESGRFRYFQRDLSPPPIRDRDRELFQRSLIGGESYEFAHGDPARAIDAYSFYLPEIQSEALRARLEFRVARAASAAGRRKLANAIWWSLVNGSGLTASEAGLPLWFLARLRAEEPDPRSLRSRTLRSLVVMRQLRFSTETLVRLTQMPELEALRGIDEFMIRIRQGLERAAQRALALSRDALVYRGENALIPREDETIYMRPRLLVIRRMKGLAGEPRVACSVKLSTVSWPPDAPVRFLGTAEEAAPSSSDAYVAVKPLRVPGLASPAGFVAVEARDFAAKVRALDRRRAIQIGLVVLLLVATVGSGLVLVIGYQRAQRLAKLKEEMLTNVTHELKTPVTSIRMFAEMLAEDPLDDTRTRRFGRMMRGESLRLTQLVENVLDFARLDRVDTDLEREPVDVGAVLRRVAEAFHYRAEEKGVEVRFDIQGDGRDLLADTHTSSVERITLNLLDNALKYRKRRDAAIALHAERAGDRVRIAVEDNGPGIPEAEQERIFEPFYRVAYDDYAVRGAGLGLAIARKLARKLGGDLRVESRAGRGSTFILELPAGGDADRDPKGDNGR